MDKKFKIKVSETWYSVEIIDLDANKAIVSVDGEEISVEIIEDVVEEIAEAVAQTAGEVMAEINSALGTAMTVEVYAWLLGVDGVTSSMSFSDAVNLFNEQYGMNLTDEEAQQAISEDICWLYGICD